MTTMTLETTLETTASVRRLEELVDRLLAALLGNGAATAETSAPGLARTVHEARRLRQSGDLDGALAALAVVETRQATDGQLRWLLRRVAGHRTAPVRGRQRAALQPGHGQGGGVDGTGRRQPGSGSGAGDGLAGGQAGLPSQPAGVEAPEQPQQPERRPGMVIATADKGEFLELRARYPLGDAVEAAGVVLRGRGRVRQGVCPFHDESEGSFTVYANTQKFHCFGCGAHGDVLDFVGRMEGLTLRQAIRRLDDGSTPRAAAQSHRPAPTQRPSAPALPPRDPALLTAAVRFYGGQLRRSSLAGEYLASRGIGLDAAMRLGLGYATGNGLRGTPASRRFHRPADQGQRPVPGTGRRAVRRDHHRSRLGPGPGAVAHRQGGATGGQAPLPGGARFQAAAGSGPPRPGAALGNCRRRSVRLPDAGRLGLPRRGRLGDPGDGQGGGGAAG